MSNKSVKSCSSTNSATRNGKRSKFPELPPKYSSSRELRNKAEKMRRDRLNGLMEDMKSMVPIISTRKNKADKTRAAVLRVTANYLRLSQLFPQNTADNLLSSEDIQNEALLGEELPHLQSLDGFFFMVSSAGKLLFVSENVEKYLGYNQIDLVGLAIDELLHQADKSKFYSYLSSQKLFALSAENSPSPFTPGSPQSQSETDRSNGAGPRRSFYVRLREKPISKNDMAQYEHMHVVGHFRSDKNIFVGVMRPVRDRPITELSLIEAIQDQYITRHLPDGRIIYSDHRISTIAGYLPSEVTGHSAFNFFYAEDLPWTTMAMRHMFASSSGEGSTVYRLFTNSGELICLQTKGFLEYNKAKNKIESFLCINTVIKSEEQEKYLREQKEKFTPFITEIDQDEKPQKIVSSKVSVIAKVSSVGGCSTSQKDAMVSENSYVTKCWNTATVTAEGGSILGKRRINSDMNSVRPKIAHIGHYESVRTEPIHRIPDGLRIIDIDHDNNIQDLCSINPSLPINDHLNFEDMIQSINHPHQPSTLNHNSVIKKLGENCSPGVPRATVTTNSQQLFCQTYPQQLDMELISDLPHHIGMIESNSQNISQPHNQTL